MIQIRRLTAPGRGAVAVVEFAAASCAEAGRLDGCFRSVSGIRPSTAAPGRILYGHWGSEDVVVVRTGEQTWEVNCHGGEAAVAKICRDLDQSAPSVISDDTPLTATRPSMLSERLLQTLLKCRTQQTARFVLNQHEGVLEEFLKSAVATNEASELVEHAQRMLQWKPFAIHLTRPWTIVVAGQPNAGKSSLLNSIVGYDRSIVFDQPGTTRDLVEVDVVLSGWPFRIIDTAGVRDNPSSEIELAGVEAARKSLASSDACLLLADASQGWTESDRTLRAGIDHIPTALVWNKIDLPTAEPVPDIDNLTALPISAMTGQGISEVTDWICSCLVPETPEPSQPLPLLPEIATLFENFLNSRDLSQLKQELTRLLQPLPTADSAGLET